MKSSHRTLAIEPRSVLLLGVLLCLISVLGLVVLLSNF